MYTYISIYTFILYSHFIRIFLLYTMNLLFVHSISSRCYILYFYDYSVCLLSTIFIVIYLYVTYFFRVCVNYVNIII